MPGPYHKNRNNHQWWITCVFLLLTFGFIFNAFDEKKAIRRHELVPKVFYSTDTVRTPFLKAETGEDERYACMDCHEGVGPPEQAPPFVEDHPHIVLRHEPAMACYTCHNREDRGMLNDIYGNPVKFEESENLCHRCHGPRYRDWLLGLHGRPNGYWDVSRGEQKRLTCVYCHNPHAPAFKPMHPSPKPHRDNYYISSKEAVPVQPAEIDHGS